MLIVPCKRCGQLGHDESHHEQALVGPDGKVKYANLVVLMKKHQNAREWEPLKPEDVPDWVKAPEVMGHLVKGECCTNETRGKEWYCALPAERAAALLAQQQAAQEKRDRKARKRVDDMRRVRRDAAHAVKH